MNLLDAAGTWCILVSIVFACRLYCMGAMQTRLGEWHAHLLTVVLSMTAVFLFGAFFLIGNPVEDMALLWWIGGLWLTMSVLFELTLRRLVLGMEWQRALSDYDLRKGRLYSLLLLTVFFTPRASYHLFFI
ncbi:MAG: hypothetical protein OEZ16_10070 [Chromatiales bacterium]|nr:hypothetical protein [Chromatiales bacterium]